MSKADEIERGRKLLAMNKQLLTGIQKQEAYCFGQDSAGRECPGCGEQMSAVEASSDAYRIGYSDGNYHCPHCKSKLRHVLPFMGGGTWFWQLFDPPFKARGGSESEKLAAELRRKHDESECTPSTCVICRDGEARP